MPNVIKPPTPTAGPGCAMHNGKGRRRRRTAALPRSKKRSRPQQDDGPAFLTSNDTEKNMDQPESDPPMDEKDLLDVENTENVNKLQVGPDNDKEESGPSLKSGKLATSEKAISPADVEKTTEAKAKMAENQTETSEFPEVDNEEEAEEAEVEQEQEDEESPTLGEENESQMQAPPETVMVRNGQELQADSSVPALMLHERTKILLGIDTRIPFSYSPEGGEHDDRDFAAAKQLGNEACREYLKLLQASEDLHGILPHGLVSTTVPLSAASEKSASSLSLETETEASLREKLEDRSLFIDPVFCLNQSNTKDSNARDTPQLLVGDAPVLSARALRPSRSWKLFSEMIMELLDNNNDYFTDEDTLEEHKEKIHENCDKETFVHITLVTSDLALLSRGGAQSSTISEHADSVSKFYRRLLSRAEIDRTNMEINLVVMTTGAGKIQQLSDASGGGSKDTYESMLLENEDIDGVARFNQSFLELYSELETITAELQPKKKSAYAPKLHIKLLDPIHISLQALWEPWTEILFNKWSLTTASGRNTRSMEVEMPETLDGVQTKLCFSLVSHICPLSSASSRLFWSCLAKEGETLSLEPVQTTQVESINASLLFGFPLTVKAASLTSTYGDDSQDEMMRALVQAFFHELYTRDQVLVLKQPFSAPYKCCDTKTRGARSTRLYVLMPKEDENGSDPLCATLFRYATGVELLDVPTNQSAPDLMVTEVKEHIQRSLDCLPCLPIDPFQV